MTSFNALLGLPGTQSGTANLLAPELPRPSTPERSGARPPVGDTRIAVAVVDDAIVAGVSLVGAGLLLKALYDFETAVGSDGKTASQVRGEVVADVAGKIHALFKNTVGLVSDKIPSSESLKASIGRGFADAGGGLGNAKASAERLMKQILGIPDGAAKSTPSPSATVQGTSPATPQRTKPTGKPVTRSQTPPANAGVRTVPSVAPLPVVTPQRANPTRAADPAAGTRETAAAAAAAKQAEIDQAAVDTLGRATPITRQLNAAVKDFYQKASGGRAARSSRHMAASLQTVTVLRRQLSDVIADSNKLVAASSANHPTLDSWRNSLVQSRNGIDVWLKDANAYAAGLTGPGGEPTQTPVLPAPPRVVLSTPGSGLSATQEAAAIQQRHDNAKASVDRGAVKPAGVKPAAVKPTTSTAGVGQGAAGTSGAAKAPKLELVTAMPASVTHTATVWVNVTTGKASATARTGSDWIKGTVGTQAMTMSDGSSKGVTGARKPPAGTYNLNQFFFQPEQDPNGKKKLNLAAIATGVFVLSSAGGLAFSVYQHGETAWQPSVALRSMPVAGELPTPDAQGVQIVATWRHFLAQAPVVLRANGVNETNVAAFEAASAAFINDQLLPVQAQLQRTADPKAKGQLLQGMANLKFPMLSLAVDAADPRAGRTMKTVDALVRAMTDGVNNSISLILNSAAVPKAPVSAPPAKVEVPPRQQAAPTVTPSAPKETQAQQDARLKALIERATPRAGTRPSTPAVTPPTVAVRPPTVATQVPSPTRSVVPPTIATTAPVTRPTPPATAKPVTPVAPPDAKTALASIANLVAAAGLTNPPPTGRLSEIKFTRAMFVDPAQESDSQALLAAIGQARKLFDAIGEVWKTSSPVVKEDINRGPWASINAVLGDLTTRYNNAQPAAPAAVPPTPDILPTLPTPDARLTPEPAMP